MVLFFLALRFYVLCEAGDTQFLFRDGYLCSLWRTTQYHGSLSRTIRYVVVLCGVRPSCMLLSLSSRCRADFTRICLDGVVHVMDLWLCVRRDAFEIAALGISSYISVLRVSLVGVKVSQLRPVIDRPYDRVQLGDNVADLPIDLLHDFELLAKYCFQISNKWLAIRRGIGPNMKATGFFLGQKYSRTFITRKFS